MSDTYTIMTNTDQPRIPLRDMIFNVITDSDPSRVIMDKIIDEYPDYLERKIAQRGSEHDARIQIYAEISSLCTRGEGKFFDIDRTGSTFTYSKMNNDNDNDNDDDNVEIGRKAILEDPFFTQVSSQTLYKFKLSRLSNKTLKDVSLRDWLVSAILQNRIDTLLRFSRPQLKKFDMGFRVVKHDVTEDYIKYHMKKAGLSKKKLKAI